MENQSPKLSVYNNATSGKDLNTALKTAFSQVRDYLLPHCGPYATTAIIGQRGRTVDQTDIFTRDGISIARALLSDVSPVARFAGRVSRFLGTVTDKKCHDGTTTAMSLFAILATDYFTYLDGDYTVAHRDRHSHAQEMRQTIGRLKASIAKNTITVDDLFALWKDQVPGLTRDDVYKAMAYQTALIASKGDVDLATAISTVIATTPIDLHGLFIKTLAPNELADKVSIIQRDYQFEVRCKIGSDVMNMDMRQKFKADNCVVMGCSRKLSDGAWDEEILYHFLGNDARSLAFLSQHGLKPWSETHGGRHLIILAPQVNSYRLMERVNQFNNAHPNNPIAIADLHIDSDSLVVMTSCLYALRGLPDPEHIEPSRSGELFLEGVSAFYTNGSLRLNGLYERDGNAVHPFYADPDANVHYTNTKDTLSRLLLEHVTDPSQSGMSEATVNICIYYYRFLCCQNITEVQLGGMLHGNKELQSVYNDAMGSAISACNHGVISDAFLKLYRDTRSRREANIEPHFLSDGIWEAGLLQLLNAVHQTNVNLIIDELPDDGDRRFVSLLSVPAEKTVVQSDLRDHSVMTQFLDLQSTKPAALIQPIQGAEEQLRRIGDILPGVMNTTLFIDMGHLDYVEHRNSDA